LQTEVDIDRLLVEYRNVLETALKEAFHSSGGLSDVVFSSALTGGKKIRPILALLTCEAVSGSYREAVPVALAYELAHNASLVQDDVIDESDYRHDMPTFHKKYGLTKAILISDLMLFEIFELLSSYGSSSLSKERLGELLHLVAKSAKLTADGEFKEVGLSARNGVSEKDSIEVAQLKTGSLFAATAASGAIIAGASDRIVTAMYQFGLSLGTAFQIDDDLLDILGDRHVLGKPVLKDLQNNASNIVLVHAISKANANERHALNSMLYSKWFTAAQVKNLLKILTNLGSIEHAKTLCSTYTKACREQLKVLPSSQAKEKLEKLTYALESRKL
jgi:geranylgeranyl diphosphate synthase, type I